MAWPTSKPTTSAFDNADDSIATSRAELETMSTAVNDIVDFIDTTNIANNKILKYNSTSGALEFVNEGASGTVTNPLTADLDVDTYKLKSTTSQVVVESHSTNPIKLHANEVHLDVQAGSGTSSPTLEFQTSSTGAGTIRNDNSANNIILFGTGGGLLTTSNGPIIWRGTGYQIGNIAGTGYALPASIGTSNQILTVSGNSLVFTTLDIALDTQPDLGGDLNTQGNKIVSNSSTNIFLEPGTGGKVRLHDAYNMPDADGGASGNIIKTDGAGNLSFTNNIVGLDTSPELSANLNVSGYGLFSNSGYNIPLTPGTGGKVLLHNVYFMPTADGTNGQAIVTDGAGNLSFATISGGSGGITDINAGNNISVNEESPGGVTVSLADPLTNPVDANNQAISNPVIRGYNEHINTGLSTSGTITPDVADGNVAVITLSGAITINTLGSVANGDSMTIILKQPASGGPHTLSSSMKFAGGTKTLSTTANAIDVMTVFYDGTDYIASLSTNFS